MRWHRCMDMDGPCGACEAAAEARQEAREAQHWLDIDPEYHYPKPYGDEMTRGNW